MKNWFIAVEKFSSKGGSSWSKYIEFSGITQAKEIVSLDLSLCPAVLSTSKFNDEDWEYSVKKDYYCGFFTDLDYVIKRIPTNDNVNILSVIRNPKKDCLNSYQDERFEFCGFDLVEKGGGISALTNCGGFPHAFNNQELNEVGLITNFEIANQVSIKLRENYPDEPHAFCDIWAIWRMKKKV